jgi:hypothetical protein
MEEKDDASNVGYAINYKFGHLRTGLEAFIANLEKKLQFMVPNLPVFVMNTGDSSYWFQGKWVSFGDVEQHKKKHTEIYQKVPRVVLSFDDVQFQSDQNSNQFTQFQYKWNDQVWNAKGRRQATNIPVVISWVCPNYIIAIDSLEALGCIMCIDNVFTYDVLGNTYEGSFASQSFSIEAGAVTPDAGAINTTIKCTVDVIMQPMMVRAETIQPIDQAKFAGTMFTINADAPTYTDAINPTDPSDPTLTKNQQQ